jgi:phosphoglycolate phosphatase-like HAD superfamily hydrolase
VSAIEILEPLPESRMRIEAALFDFDGTISTLRQGWETVMRPLMIEMISGPYPPDDNLVREVDEYIDESTGIQTIFQMQWLAEAVKRYGRNPEVHDSWWYKAEYNRRLMNIIEGRIKALEEGKQKPEDYMVCGVKDFLEALRARGIKLFVASGTDHPDVVREVKALGLANYFTEIAGAPLGQAGCSKEAVLRRLITERGLCGQQLLVVGDGKVEIGLGREVGAVTLGAATDEINRRGINEAKRRRLMKAGAHAIVGDFVNYKDILEWLKLL